MKTLKLDSGDLSLVGGDYATVDGTSKVVQDLDGALRERIRSDPYHSNWGSVLPYYVGQPLTEAVQQRCVIEVRRVINNYALVQRAEVTAASAAAVGSKLTATEMVQSISTVGVSANADRLVISVGLTTLSGDQIDLRPVVG